MRVFKHRVRDQSVHHVRGEYCPRTEIRLILPNGPYRGHNTYVPVQTIKSLLH